LSCNVAGGARATGAGAIFLTVVFFFLLLFFILVLEAGQKSHVGRGLSARFRDDQQWRLPERGVWICVQDSGWVDFAD
jgi:hypothetical protein